MPPPVIYTYASCGSVTSRIVVGSGPPPGSSGGTTAQPVPPVTPSASAPAPVARRSSAELVAELAAEFGLNPDDSWGQSSDGSASHSANSSCRSSGNADWRPASADGGGAGTSRCLSDHGPRLAHGRASSLPFGGGGCGGQHSSGGPLGARRLSAADSEFGVRGGGDSFGSDPMAGGGPARGVRKLSFRSDNSLSAFQTLSHRPRLSCLALHPCDSMQSTSHATVRLHLHGQVGGGAHPGLAAARPVAYVANGHRPELLLR